MAPGQLQAAASTAGFGLHPWRAALDTPERLRAARDRIEDLRGVHTGALWRREGTTPGDVARLQGRALAAAWARLGGADDGLFHLRRVAHVGADLWISPARGLAPRVAIDANPGVRPAPCLEHPISLDEVARFAILRPMLRRCAELGAAATRALDAIGQPTHALQRWAAQCREPPRRRPVWQPADPSRGDRPRLRMLTLLANHLVVAIGGRAVPGPLDGVPALLRHPSEWSRLEAAVLGELAWRIASARELLIARDPGRGWHTIHPRPAVLGRRYGELEDPFVPLLALLRLGCGLVAYSPGTMTFELQG